MHHTGAEGPTCKEVEDSPLHLAQHGQEALTNHKGQQEVDHGVECSAGRACVQRLDLGAHQPGDGAPTPRMARDEEAYNDNEANDGSVTHGACCCHLCGHHGTHGNHSCHHLKTTLNQPETATQAARTHQKNSMSVCCQRTMMT